MVGDSKRKQSYPEDEKYFSKSYNPYMYQNCKI